MEDSFIIVGVYIRHKDNKNITYKVIMNDTYIVIVKFNFVVYCFSLIRLFRRRKRSYENYKS